MRNKTITPAKQAMMDTVDPELLGPISRFPALPLHRLSLIPLMRWIYGRMSHAPVSDDVQVSTASHDGLDIRIYQPQGGTNGAALLGFFGGGHIMGRASHMNVSASHWALELGATVFVPDYRLSPKHPFPADLDDGHSCWTWMLAQADAYNIDTNRIGLIGFSAGGGIAAALAQRLADEGGIQPALQCLYYPMLDDRTATQKELDAVGHYLWNNRFNRAAWTAYLNPHKPGETELPPYAAPNRRSDLSGLPRTWLGIGTVDLFYQECLDYAERLKVSGTACDLHVAEGMPHAAEKFMPHVKVCQDFESSAMTFLKRHL